MVFTTQANEAILEYCSHRVIHPLLEKYIDCIYSLSSPEGGSYYCVPNGKCGLSFVLNGQFTYPGPGEEMVQVPRYAVFGMIKEPVRVYVSAGFSEVTIVFKSHGLQHFTGRPVGDLLRWDGEAPVDSVWQEKELEGLREELAAAAGFPARCRRLESFLLQSFCNRRGDARVDAAVAQIAAANGATTVKKLGEQLRVTPRTLHTLFTRNVGLAPKECIQITRFYKSLCHRPAAPFAGKTMTEYAYCLGYCDQSHFINDFKRFAGRSPHRYFACNALTNDFYKYRRWLTNHYEK